MYGLIKRVWYVWCSYVWCLQINQMVDIEIGRINWTQFGRQKRFSETWASDVDFMFIFLQKRPLLLY